MLRGTLWCVQAHVLNSQTYIATYSKGYVRQQGRHGVPHTKLKQ